MRGPGYVSDMSTENYRGVALLIGVAVPLFAIFVSWGWMRGSTDLVEMVARAVAVGSVIVAAGAISQAGQYPDPAPTFWGRLGSYLTAGGAVYVALFSIFGALVPWFLG